MSLIKVIDNINLLLYENNFFTIYRSGLSCRL
jgi:hypothetical protein